MVSLARFCKQAATCDCKNSQLNRFCEPSRWSLHALWWNWGVDFSFGWRDHSSVSLTAWVSSEKPFRSSSQLLVDADKGHQKRHMATVSHGLGTAAQEAMLQCVGLEVFCLFSELQLINGLVYRIRNEVASKHDIQITNLWLILLAVGAGHIDFFVWRSWCLHLPLHHWSHGKDWFGTVKLEKEQIACNKSTGTRQHHTIGVR